MRDIILQKIEEIESSNEVKILFACESGSRAWGFSSPDSDYDVRFVYAHHADWYLTIEDRKDIIELPVNEVLDISGWDIRKALKLFRSSNSVIYEWLQSPIIYKEEQGFIQDLFSMRSEFYSLRSGLHHYLSMTLNAFQTDLQDEEFKLKKYFYALRPILAASWIIDKQECPPMEFSKLRALVSDRKVDNRIDDLLLMKKKENETYVTKADPLIHEFLKDRISYCEVASRKITPLKTQPDNLNELFRKTIGINL